MSLSAPETAIAPASDLGRRKILLFDAAIGLGMGLPLMEASDALSELSGFPKSFIFWAGVVLLP